ncbi:hypothetical protein LJ739_00205 [Aestuariibacter halophilus]|uniref:Chromosome segregation ATPase n=1 Tax=Fluctibacter halophilus TaxID=226011 RepID=A0ABS8G2D7_9ALTE|nr:hypothetical protein [Aestuariibacter halophilus]MCC2614659.1 hypothetical protein [Aestuariibacter halophilus]
MSNEPFESDIPKIVLDQEDREAYQRKQQPGNRKAPPPTSDAPEPKSSGGKGLAVFSLLVALGACGASGYLFHQNQQQLAAAKAAEQRIEDLEQRLSATGEELDQSAVALQVKVKELVDKTGELWEQMDKLWASAWRRNQSEIAELRTQLGDQSQLNNTLKKQLSVLETDLSLAGTNLALLQEQLNGNANDISQANKANTLQAKDIASLGEQLVRLNNELAEISKQTRGLGNRLNELEKWQRTQPTTTKPPLTVGAANP